MRRGFSHARPPPGSITFSRRRVLRVWRVPARYAAALTATLPPLLGFDGLRVEVIRVLGLLLLAVLPCKVV